MSVSYAGLPLTAPTPKILELIDIHGGLGEITDFQLAAWNGLGGRNADYGPTREAKLGHLLWPTGASRFAIGHFVASQTQLDNIRKVIKPVLYSTSSSSQAAAAELRLWDDADEDNLGTEIATDMYLLSPWPLFRHADADQDVEALWLLTMVDIRYFWWWKRRSIFVDPGVTTWQELIDDIFTGLGVTDSSVLEIAEAYLKPHGSLSTYSQYLPPLLDAVAYSIGRRVVRQLTGKIVLQKPENGRQANLDLLAEWREWTIQGGSMAIGDDGEPEARRNIWATAPSSVNFSLRQIDVTVLEENSVSDTIADSSSALADLDIDEYQGQVQRGGYKLVRTTAVRWTNNGVETNDDEIAALVEQWATDWYRWQLADEFRFFSSIIPWDGCGMAEYVEWQAWPNMTTRVTRPPLNDLADTVYHYTFATAGTCPHAAGFDDFFPARVGCHMLYSGTPVYAFTEVEYLAAISSPTTLADGRQGYPPTGVTTEILTAGDSGTSQVERITICGPPFTGGTWDLGSATSLAHDINATDLSTALTASESATITATGSMTTGWTITYSGTGAHTALAASVGLLLPQDASWPAMELNNATVASGTIVWMKRVFVPAIAARVVITKTGTDPDTFELYLDGVTGGAWTITWDSVTSADIEWGRTAAEIETIVEALQVDLDLSTFSGTGTLADPWVFTVDSDNDEHEVSVSCVNLRDGSGFRFEHCCDGVDGGDSGGGGDPPAGTVSCASNPDELMLETIYIKFTLNGAEKVVTMIWDGATKWEYDALSAGDCLSPICGDFHVSGFAMVCGGGGGGSFGFEMSTTRRDDCVFEAAFGDVSFASKVVVDYSPFNMTLQVSGAEPGGPGTSGCDPGDDILYIEISEEPF